MLGAGMNIAIAEGEIINCRGFIRLSSLIIIVIG